MTENKIVQLKSSTNSCNCKGLPLCFVDGHSISKVQWNGTELGLLTTVVITEPSMLVVSNRHCTIWHNQTEEQATNMTQEEIYSDPRGLWTLRENSGTKPSYLNHMVRCHPAHHVIAWCAVTRCTMLSHVQHLSCGCSCYVHKMWTVTHFGIFWQFLLHGN